MLIGIAGRARSGKDSMADVLVQHYGFVRYALADPIKAGARAMLGLTREHTDGDHKETPIPGLDVSPRHIMQTLGTEWGRDTIRDDLWLRVADRILADIESPVVVPDIRMENEADWVREQGGHIWHVRRRGIETVRAHKTEAGVELDEDDILLSNDGTLADLEQLVREIMRDEYAK